MKNKDQILLEQAYQKIYESQSDFIHARDLVDKFFARNLGGPLSDDFINKSGKVYDRKGYFYGTWSAPEKKFTMDPEVEQSWITNNGEKFTEEWKVRANSKYPENENTYAQQYILTGKWIIVAQQPKVDPRGQSIEPSKRDFDQEWKDAWATRKEPTGPEPRITRGPGAGLYRAEEYQ